MGISVMGFGVNCCSAISFRSIVTVSGQLFKELPHIPRIVF